MDTFSGFLDDLRSPDGGLNLKKLITEYSEDILDTDFHALKAHYLSNAIPPDAEDLAPRGEDEDHLGQFICKLTALHGGTCDMTYATQQKLAAHQRNTI